MRERIIADQTGEIMKVGASYYPELLDATEWERDLAAGREIGLSSLRCGEFAWSALSPKPGAWDVGWALRFLDVAARHGYEVIWCTPSATPPPYLFNRWPDLHAFNIDDRWVPLGVRRQYCPSHGAYIDICEQTAEHLAQDLGGHPALAGWQVDNEIAGDGFTCWCPRCGVKFQQWLRERYVSLDHLNELWQTGVWSQVYTDWEQIPIPHRCWAHAPAIKLDFRRFRSDNWLRFYRAQYRALRGGGARRVTTNFYNLTWDVPFDQWAWRQNLDAIGVSHYLEEEIASHFQLALLQGASPGEKPLWVLEQKAGQQAAQNLYPEDLFRIENHLRICADHGAEYAIYWHLRQHSAGCEMEHGAVLRHDGKPGRIARAIQLAIAVTENLTPHVPAADSLLVFSFQQHWANENRPQPGSRWSYREEIEQSWYGGARDALAGIRVGGLSDIGQSHRLILAPFLQLDEPEMMDRIWNAFEAGATVVTTVDLARLDDQNNVRRIAPLGSLAPRIDAPALEVLHLKEGFKVHGQIGVHAIHGRHFWAIPDGPLETGRMGWLGTEDCVGPAALRFKVGQGSLVVALSALDRAGVAALITEIRGEE